MGVSAVAPTRNCSPPGPRASGVIDAAASRCRPMRRRGAAGPCKPDHAAHPAAARSSNFDVKLHQGCKLSAVVQGGRAVLLRRLPFTRGDGEVCITAVEMRHRRGALQAAQGLTTGENSARRVSRTRPRPCRPLRRASASRASGMPIHRRRDRGGESYAGLPQRSADMMELLQSASPPSYRLQRRGRSADLNVSMCRAVVSALHRRRSSTAGDRCCLIGEPRTTPQQAGHVLRRKLERQAGQSCSASDAQHRLGPAPATQSRGIRP
jgi:hypothetical protein